METGSLLTLFDSFDELHPELREAHRRFVVEHGRDTPVLECSNYARALFNTYANWKQSEVGGLFELIETALTSGGELEQAAVATGFLELLVHQMDESPPARAALVPFFGPKAREFCRAYNQFGGVHWPELAE